MIADEYDLNDCDIGKDCYSNETFFIFSNFFTYKKNRAQDAFLYPDSLRTRFRKEYISNHLQSLRCLKKC